jgi:hypothetical protein
MVMLASALPVMALWFAPIYENDEEPDTLAVDTSRAPEEACSLQSG